MPTKLEYRQVMLDYKAELDLFSFAINNNVELAHLKEKYGELLTKNYVFFLHSEFALEAGNEEAEYFFNEAIHSTEVFKKLNGVIRGAYERQQ